MMMTYCGGVIVDDEDDEYYDDNDGHETVTDDSDDNQAGAVGQYLFRKLALIGHFHHTSHKLIICQTCTIIISNIICQNC